MDNNYYLTDEQGSVRYVLDADGNVQNDYRYDAFGQRIAGQENIPNRLRYNAQIEDDQTGLYYLRARYYNTGNGRFTQEDVIYNDGLNLYAYCSSNPVMYSDPSGFAKKPCKSKVGGECGSESGSSSLIDIDAIRPKLKTEPDTAFFWSGRTDGIGGAENAANIAKSRGGVTLESTIETQNIVMPEWDFNNPSTMEAWDLASGAYAEQVSGEIRAVIGSELRPGNIWENVELPRLKNNPNVTKITTIDPKTGVENIIFER